MLSLAAELGCLSIRDQGQAGCTHWDSLNLLSQFVKTASILYLVSRDTILARFLSLPPTVLMFL